MPWQRVGLVVDGDRAEALAEALEDAGAVSTDLSDADAGTPEEHAVFACTSSSGTVIVNGRIHGALL